MLKYAKAGKGSTERQGVQLKGVGTPVSSICLPSSMASLCWRRVTVCCSTSQDPCTPLSSCMGNWSVFQHLDLGQSAGFEQNKHQDIGMLQPANKFDLTGRSCTLL